MYKLKEKKKKQNDIMNLLSNKDLIENQIYLLNNSNSNNFKENIIMNND